MTEQIEQYMRTLKPVSYTHLHRLPAVGRLLGPVVFGDFLAYCLENIGKPPRREFACLNRYCYGTSGNVLVYQPLSLLPCEKAPLDNVSRSAAIAPVPCL